MADRSEIDEQLLKSALKTVEEMLEDRLYIPIAKEFPAINIIERMNNRKYITSENKFAFVTVVDSISQIKNFSELIKDDNYETIIFVYTNNVNKQHKSLEKTLNHKIEIWSIYNLQINVSRHHLQPAVSKINYDVQQIDKKLPKILFYDPICRYFRFHQKDVIKVISGVDGNIHYRYVV